MKITKELKIKWFYLIVPGLITTALWELGQYVWGKLPEAGKSLFQYFEDIPYRQASSLRIGGLVIAILFITVIFLTIKTILPVIKSLRKVWKARKVLKSLKQVKTNIADTHIKADKKEENDLPQDLSEITKEIVWIGIKGVLLSLFTCFWLFQVIIFPLFLNDTFDRYIVIVAPYTDDDTIKKLKSDWMLMETKEDYEAIDASITEILEEHNLK